MKRKIFWDKGAVLNVTILMFQSHIKSNLSNHLPRMVEQKFTCSWALSIYAFGLDIEMPMSLTEGFLGWSEPALFTVNVRITPFPQNISQPMSEGIWCINTLSFLWCAFQGSFTRLVLVTRGGSLSNNVPFIGCLPWLISLLLSSANKLLVLKCSQAVFLGKL